MFLGHYAVALGAKRAAPKTSLGTLVLAAQFIDLLWPVLLLLGFEHVRLDPGNTAVTPLDFYDYPITHSLTGVLVWAVVVGGVYFAIKRSWKSALVVAGGCGQSLGAGSDRAPAGPSAEISGRRPGRVRGVEFASRYAGA